MIPSLQKSSIEKVPKTWLLGVFVVLEVSRIAAEDQVRVFMLIIPLPPRVGRLPACFRLAFRVPARFSASVDGFCVAFCPYFFRT